ncbi:MAG: hypothetical protein HKN87_22250 [Saprospiraceae bacterium]|nr:hypothetical protein [Saprospiraceae bacterium]
MALFSFFKTPRHQKFKYIPRYYDPQKERLEEILANARGEGTGETELVKSRIAASFQRKSGSHRSARSAFVTRSNILLVGIIIILFGLTYLLLTVYLPDFISQIEG